MKKAEYKEMDTKDLRARLETAEKEYLQTKVNHSISPLDNPAKITQDRRMIARMKPELRKRELNEKLSQRQWKKEI